MFFDSHASWVFSPSTLVLYSLSPTVSPLSKLRSSSLNLFGCLLCIYIYFLDVFICLFSLDWHSSPLLGAKILSCFLLHIKILLNLTLMLHCKCYSTWLFYFIIDVIQLSSFTLHDSWGSSSRSRLKQEVAWYSVFADLLCRPFSKICKRRTLRHTRASWQAVNSNPYQ